jgi:sRNA-binding carbon storage regulator CsrA
MLVLSRKCQESVVVGDADRSERVLKVTVLEISRGHVRLVPGLVTSRLP